jgi:ABC-type multidrug transport system ATPase subunit
MALKGEMTIVIVSHRLASLDFCDRVVALVDGRVIAEGSTADVLAESDALFGVEGLPEQDSV